MRFHTVHGDFLLERNARGALSFSGPAGALSPPDGGEVTLWDGCTDSRGRICAALYTQSRHLLYCICADGRHWSRQALSRVDREDVELMGLKVAPEQLIYLLSGEGGPVCVRFFCPEPQRWQARRLLLPDPGRPLLGTLEENRLYTAFSREGRCFVYEQTLEPPAGRLLLSAPGEAKALAAREGHILLSTARGLYADGFRLGEGGEDLCFSDQEGLAAHWTEQSAPRCARWSPEDGWRMAAPPPVLPAPPPPGLTLEALAKRVEALEARLGLR